MFDFSWKISSNILNSLPDGIYFVDRNRKIKFWSRSAERLTGFTSDDMLSTSFDDYKVKYEDVRGKALQAFELPVAISLQERKVIRKDLFIIKNDSTKTHIEEIAAPLFKGEEFWGVISAIRDISLCVESVQKLLKEEKKERLVPICGWCKKIRNSENSWEKLEVYLTNEGFGVFTHGMCPSCAEKIFEKKIYLESYQNICKSISSSISLDEVLQLIVSNVVKVMNVKASSLRLMNEDLRQLELVAYHGLSERYANKGPVAYDRSIDDALEGKSVSVYDITEHKDSRYYRDATAEGIRSILSIPLRSDSKVIGVLRMYTSEPVNYTEEDLKFISAIAEQAAIAIINARRFEKAVSIEKEYLMVFGEVTKAVSSTLNVNEVLDMIVKKIPEVMKLKAATIRLLDHTGKKLKLVASYGLSQKYLGRGPVDTEENVMEALNEKPVAIYDVTTDSRVTYQKEAIEEGIKSMLTLPVMAKGKVLGILRLLTGAQREFSLQEINFAASLAEQCGIAIENATMYEKISKDYDDIMKHLDGAVIERKQ